MSAQTTEKHKDWILDIIDQLRKRKARPDLERITHFVERKHGLNRKETEAHLERLVDKGIVIKVVYKRGTSYRNATKSRRRNYVSNVLNSNLASYKINEAVSGILKERRRLLRRAVRSGLEGQSDNEEMETDSDEDEEEEEEGEEEMEGVSTKEIENWLVQNDEDIGPYPLNWAIQNEVDAGRLARIKNGNYAPAREKKTATNVQNGSTQALNPLNHGVTAKRGRPPKLKLSRLNRSVSQSTAQQRCAALMMEPESAPVPVMPPHLCDFCQKTRDENKQGQPEELLFCKDCNAKAHPSCMNYSPELATRARKTSWQCIDCKTCCICSDPDDADNMLFCDACDKGYHMSCHNPKLEDEPQGKWVCSECVNDGVNIDDIEENTFCSGVDSTVKSTDLESCTSFRIIKRDLLQEKYPDARNWSISDVVSFFHEKGFNEQAEAFKSQEIDGQSLLLLKRSDVLQGLSLKLGPALKIYNHVMKLQTACQPSV